MAKVNALIQKVSARQVDGVQKVLIEMVNGDQLWVNMTYVNKLLASMFLEGARPTALQGSTVSYNKVTHKAGESVKDKAGKEVEGVAAYKKDGYSIFDFQVEEEGDKAIAYGEMHDKQAVKAKLKGAFSGFMAKASVAKSTPVVEGNDIPQVEEEEEVKVA